MPIKPSILNTLIVLMLMCFTTSAFAEVKIAVIDVQNAILQSAEAKRLLQQIQEEFKDQETEIRQIQSEATAIVERLQKDVDVMSDAEKRRLQQQVESKNNDFTYLRQKLQKQIEGRQQELFSGIDNKMQKAIEDLVLSDDYDMILPSQAALYVGDLYDITKKVTEKLNQMDKGNQ